jgi:hypothetical protein
MGCCKSIQRLEQGGSHHWRLRFEAEAMLPKPCPVGVYCLSVESSHMNMVMGLCPTHHRCRESNTHGALQAITAYTLKARGRDHLGIALAHSTCQLLEGIPLNHMQPIFFAHHDPESSLCTSQYTRRALAVPLFTSALPDVGMF